MGLETQDNALFWVDRQDEPGWLPAERSLGRESLVRHRAKLNGDFRCLLGQALPGAQIKRHVLPAPVVEEQLQCDKRLRPGIARHAVFFAITGRLFSVGVAGTILSAHRALRDRVALNRTGRMEHVRLLVADLVGVE